MKGRPWEKLCPVSSPPPKHFQSHPDINEQRSSKRSKAKKQSKETKQRNKAKKQSKEAKQRSKAKKQNKAKKQSKVKQSILEVAPSRASWDWLRWIPLEKLE